MMAGAVSVLSAARCALVGGHSSEGPEPALGFSITGADHMETAAVLLLHPAPATLIAQLLCGSLFETSARRGTSMRVVNRCRCGQGGGAAAEGGPGGGAGAATDQGAGRRRPAGGGHAAARQGVLDRRLQLSNLL